MKPDYPAAHSTDASWYAVDQAGSVALFITGAGGAIPNGAYSPEGAELLVEEFDPEEIEELGLGEGGPASIPSELRDIEHLFVYGSGGLDECLTERYRRRQIPEQPLHVDQLPPQVREAVGKVCFDSLDFCKTEVFQPVELTQCGAWDPAYLAGDGKTVKPMPGREREYAEFIRDAREYLEQDGLTCEEPATKKEDCDGS